MKIKGYYEAQIRISLCEDAELSPDEILGNMTFLEDAVRILLEDELMLSDKSKVTVTKVYANVWEVKE